MKTSKLMVLLLIILSARGAFACINDRDSDTLANEGKQLPDVVRVITGRFERNPPLYYQMRITRVGKELQSHPERLPLYDDIAVAYDRLGKDNDAISWMNRKKSQLARVNTKTPANHEALYRYYANNGTFWAHRWLRNGANRAKLNEVKIARDLIAQAIKIKPNAHFGREKYQLMTMDWIIDPRAKDDDGKMRTMNLADYISAKIPDEELGKPSQMTGLSGLIVLGNAWESVDIFYALSGALDANGKPTLQYLSILRCRELISQGKRSLLPNTGTGAQLQSEFKIDADSLQPIHSIAINVENQAAIDTVYNRLRTEAEAWQARRTAYMMTRLKAGKHPDTDKMFWRDWHDTAPPSMDVAWYSVGAAKRNGPAEDLLMLQLFFISVFLIPLSWRIMRLRFVAYNRRSHSNS